MHWSSFFPEPLTEIRQYCHRLHVLIPEVTIGEHVLRLISFSTTLQYPFTVTYSHSHNEYELWILLDGSAEYPGGTPQIISPGTMLLFAPHVRHRWRPLDRSCITLAIRFTTTPLAVNIPSLWPKHPNIIPEVALLLNEARSGEFGWQLRAKTRLQILCLTCLSYFCDPVKTDLKRSHGDALFMEAVDNFLQKNLSRHIIQADVARITNMSTKTLYRRIMRLTGGTMSDILHAMRIDLAHSLLLESDLTIGEIARRVGIQHQSNFCRWFLYDHKISPLTYRRIYTSLSQDEEQVRQIKKEQKEIT